MTNIEVQKLWFIEQILKIDNLTLLDGLKELFINYTTEFKPMTWQELQEKIDIAEKDFEEGRCYTDEELDLEMEKW